MPTANSKKLSHDELDEDDDEDGQDSDSPKKN